MLSHSLDNERDVVLTSRGQTMSVAFYPSTGMVTFGSEAAATKACMGMADADAEQPSFRFDLDDVAGEVVLLRWGEPPSPRAPAAGPARDCMATAGKGGATAVREGPGATHLICCAGHESEAVEVFRLGGPGTASGSGGARSTAPRGGTATPARALLCVNILQHGEQVPMWRRRLQLDGNPLLSAPAGLLCADPVGKDLLDTPGILKRITADFDSREHSFNRISAWTFTSKLRERLKWHRAGTHDRSVDLLITGCEVSLWIGEQFASDLKLVYPTLHVEVRSLPPLSESHAVTRPLPQSQYATPSVTFHLTIHDIAHNLPQVISSNKLLGQLGQSMPIPQPGFRFNCASHNFNRTIVLMLSHSGGELLIASDCF